MFTPLAERQLDELFSYIETRSNEARAEHYVGRIIAFCESLVVFPMRGARHDDLLSGLRTIGYKRTATIAFVVTRDTILIEGVFHRGQDFAAFFQDGD